MSRRATILRVARRAFKLARAGWDLFTPQILGLSGLFMTHVTGSRFVGGFMVIWAIDLAYQRGKAAETIRIGAIMSDMVCGERSVEITVMHEHRAAPAARPEARS